MKERDKPSLFCYLYTMIKSIYFGNCLTVGELIEKLREFPQDLPVCSECFGIDVVEKRTCVDSNYPYNRPDEDYIYIG